MKRRMLVQVQQKSGQNKGKIHLMIAREVNGKLRIPTCYRIIAIMEVL